MKMLKDPKFNFLTQKITLSYLFLGITAIVAIIIIYDGINNIIHIDESTYSPNKKLYLTNKILTKIYDAEGDARSYYLYRNKADLDLYIKKATEIQKGIDTISILSATNKIQQNTISNIKQILNQQQKNIEQLIKIDNKDQKEELYKRAMEEVYIKAYDFMPQPKVVKQNTTTKRDSVFKKSEKDNFFKKVKNLFSTKDEKPQQAISQVTVEQNVTYDTILQTKASPDSLIKMVQHSLDKLKQRDNYLKAKIVSNETQLIQSNRILLNNLREMVSSLENEEIFNSTASLNKSRDILNKTYTSVKGLGIVTLFLFTLFIIIISRAIQKNKKYNIALLDAQKKSIDLVHLKEQFLTNMSHEIRTPLSSIIGFSEQLNRTTLSHQQGIYLKTIQQSSDHLLSLVNDILDLSKINAGKFHLENIQFNILELINEIHQNFQFAAQNKGIEISYSVDEMLKSDVIGDPMRLRQVLINLVGNAIKFTEHGSVKIVGSSEIKQSGYLLVTLSIIDTGVGITQEQQGLIFDEFSQADPSVTRKFGGTGLGLSIASKIVKLFQGEINVSSKPGKGSTFTFRISFEKAQKAVLSPDQPVTLNIIELLRDKKILIIDDDETILLLINIIFSNAGLKCESTTKSTEALEKIKNEHYDLIFTDLHMPEMSGFELIKNIKIQYKNRTTPLIVALTAHSNIIDEYKKAGFTSYLSKPFKEVDFLNKIIEVLGLSQTIDIKPTTVEKEKKELLNSNLLTYSIDGILEFTDKDSKSFQKIMNSFVANSLITIEEIKQLNTETQKDEIANRAHKLIPLFKQLKMIELAGILTKLERYKELGITDDEFQKTKILAIEISEKMVYLIESEQFKKVKKVEPL